MICCHCSFLMCYYTVGSVKCSLVTREIGRSIAWSKGYTTKLAQSAGLSSGGKLDNPETYQQDFHLVLGEIETRDERRPEEEAWSYKPVSEKVAKGSPRLEGNHARHPVNSTPVVTQVSLPLPFNAD